MNDARVDADDVFALGHKELPPGVLDILLEFAPQGTVVVKAGVPVVNLTRGKDNPPTFAETDNLVHRVLDLEGFDFR